MLFWTFQITLISIILIFLVHHLIIFFKSTLTVPKVKDLINAPVQKYENMYNTINTLSSSSNNSTYIDELLPKEIKPDVKSMKDELKSFLKNKIKGNIESDKELTHATNISTLDSFSSPNYSAY